MCTIFWDSRGVILQEYLSKDETINAVRYCETLRKITSGNKKQKAGNVDEWRYSFS